MEPANTDWLPGRAWSEPRGRSLRRLDMLVLTRRPDQRINLYLKTEHGPKLLGSILVVKATDKIVRLGFDEFGPEVSILRGELEQPTGAK
jgi:sRNA-binding carbon storage regulator CsrA